MGAALMLRELLRSPENPRTSLSNPAGWLFTALGAEQSTSGVMVSETKALGYSAVYACINALSKDVAQIPLPVYSRNGGNRQRAPNHPIYNLLHDRPNPEITPFTFKQTAQAHLTGWGNAYAEIEFNNAGRPLWFWPLPPDRTHVERVDGKKILIVRLPDGKDQPIPPGRYLHLPGLGYDGLQGYSVIRMAKNAIGAGMAIEEFGASLFARGARPSGILSHPANPSDKARENLRQAFDVRYGGLSNAHRTMLLEEGIKWEQMQISPEDSQFIESGKFALEQVARFFDMPLVRLNHTGAVTTWGSGVAEFLVGYLKHTINPWLVLWEETLNWELFDATERPRFYAEFLREAFLAADPAKRATLYNQLFQVAAITPNQIAARENLPTYDGGDEHYVPANFIPVSMAKEAAAEKTTPEPKGGRAIVRERLRTNYTPLLEAAWSRVINREVRELRKNTRGLPDALAVSRLGGEYFARQGPLHDYAVKTVGPVLRVYADAIAAESARDAGTEPPDLEATVTVYVSDVTHRQGLNVLGRLCELSSATEIDAVLDQLEAEASAIALRGATDLESMIIQLVSSAAPAA